MNLATQTTEPNRLDDLCAELQHAKTQEKVASDYRKSVEDKILELIPDRKEGANRLEGNFFKATVTEGLTRKITNPIALARTVTPEQFDKLVRIKYELNTARLRNFEEMQPDLYAKVCDHIESKPRKPSVKIESV